MTIIVPAKATPRPWKQDAWYVVGPIAGGRPGGEVIVRCELTISRPRDEERDRANAELIVAAVNAYDQDRLLALLGGSWIAAFRAIRARVDREPMRTATREWLNALLTEAAVEAVTKEVPE